MLVWLQYGPQTAQIELNTVCPLPFEAHVIRGRGGGGVRRAFTTSLLQHKSLALPETCLLSYTPDFVWACRLLDSGTVCQVLLFVSSHGGVHLPMRICEASMSFGDWSLKMLSSVDGGANAGDCALCSDDGREENLGMVVRPCPSPPLPVTFPTFSLVAQ